MEKVRITRVVIKDTDKSGSPLKDKNGKKMWRVGIQTDRYGEKWLSTLSFRQDDACMNLKAGDEVTMKVESKGDFMNFSLPTKTDLLEARIYALEHRVQKLEASPVERVPAKIPGTDVEYPEGPNPNDVPF